MQNSKNTKSQVAALTKKVIDSDDLYSQADQALYQAKRAGKNQACIYKER